MLSRVSLTAALRQFGRAVRVEDAVSGAGVPRLVGDELFLNTLERRSGEVIHQARSVNV